MSEINISSPHGAPEAQPVTQPPGRTAFFISLHIADTPQALDTVRGFCEDFPALLRSMMIRDTSRSVNGVIGFGAVAWDRLFGSPRPAHLHIFEEIRGTTHVAPSTPADLFFHLRADTMDVCFELARLIMVKLGDAVIPHDEVQAFRSFDGRSIVGFIDGTENPTNNEAYEVAVVGVEDPEFSGGSYALIQRYEHNMDAWNSLPTEEQEKAIGRRKFDDLELSDEDKPSNAHNALTNITDDDGNELKIVRANLPYGNPSKGVYGTFFIGYAKDPSITERMLNNMFIGDPPGNHDRLLDFSTAVTGALFFVPSFDLLDELSQRVTPGEGGPAPVSQSNEELSKNSDGSLVIGSLKQKPQNIL